MSLDELIRVYCSLNAVAPVTERGYVVVARGLGHPTVDEITYNMLMHAREQCGSPNTWNTTLGKLRALIRFAVKLGSAHDAHPVFKVKRLHVPPSKRTEITEHDREQFIQILEHSKKFNPSWFWVAVFDVLYYSGIRRKQLCHLRWGDLDLHNSTILLRAAGAKNKRERLLPLHQQLTESLRRYREHMQATLRGFPLDSSTQVFNLKNVRGGKANNELQPYEVTEFFIRLSNISGMHITAHILRHSFATKISREIPNIRTVQILLNHDRVETTMQYIHPTLTDMRAVMNLPLMARKK